MPALHPHAYPQQQQQYQPTPVPAQGDNGSPAPMHTEPHHQGPPPTAHPQPHALPPQQQQQEGTAGTGSNSNSSSDDDGNNTTTAAAADLDFTTPVLTRTVHGRSVSFYRPTYFTGKMAFPTRYAVHPPTHPRPQFTHPPVSPLYTPRYFHEPQAPLPFPAKEMERRGLPYGPALNGHPQGTVLAVHYVTGR